MTINAAGRVEHRRVKAYLEALEADMERQPSHSPEWIENKLAKLDEQIEAKPSPIVRIQLMQNQADLKADLERIKNTVDLRDLELGFIADGRAYAEKIGITYGTWREFGVPAQVLREAGISR